MNKLERKLLSEFEQLNEEGQNQLLDYALFLKGKYKAEPAPKKPLDIARPNSENVIDAIKRLSKTYPMIEKKKIMGSASDLLTQHMMQGRAADEVIDELEELFENHYKKSLR